MSRAYYNENDPKIAAWLRELIKEGLIANGDVDDRSIEDVRSDDVKGYCQCHFFAGIGGWSYALRLAGWPNDRPVWTGSCPCQPFSLAGERWGTKDRRDLWPVFARLAIDSDAPEMFGEQVVGAIRWGWLDRAFDDLESANYACGSAVLPAIALGANHIRERCFWAARPNTYSVRPQGKRTPAEGSWSREQFEGLVQAAIRASVRASVPAGESGGLSDGIPARMVRLRGYGNAIVPQVAAEFIAAYMDIER